MSDSGETRVRDRFTQPERPHTGGSKAVRIAYLDEAGISNPVQEPYLVVAGVLIDADNGWRRLQRELEYLAEEYELPDIRRFHAKDIFHGTGLFDRNDPDWPNARRRELLLKLASVPKSAGLPVVVGHIHRPTFARAAQTFFEKQGRLKNKKIKVDTGLLQQSAHMEAFLRAARDVDLWVSKNAPSEQVMLIVENNDRAKRAIKIVHAVFQDKHFRLDMPYIMTKSFKSSHIIETVHFADKYESPLMQVADICAFVIKRHLQKRDDVREFYEAIEPQMVKGLALDADGTPKLHLVM